MKKFLFFSLITMTFSVYAEPLIPKIITKKLPENTVMRQHVSVEDATTQLLSRTIDYPTQIVRMEAAVTGEAQTCDEVFKKIDTFFSNHLTSDKFFYNTINYCSYDPQTHFAKTFAINSYFDPISNAAIPYLEKYLADHNGYDLLGSPFYVESAQAMIVSLDLDAGVEENPNDDAIIRLYHDNASHYFTNQYQMRIDLLKDMRHRFFTHDARLVLPFIGKWFLTPAGVYLNVLSNANYVEVRPELIFLMNKEPKLFTPLLKLYYANHCEKYSNQHCL